MRRDNVLTLTGFRMLRVALVPACGLALLTSCSSSSTSSSPTRQPSATTTQVAVPPVPPNASAVAAYLNASGTTFLHFERVTAPLGKGTIPSKTTCQNLAKTLSPQGASSPDAITTVIRGIPNVAIQVAATQDLQAKLELLSTCAQGTATERTALQASAAASVITKELSQLGIQV
jgi:hypothetical protein